MAWDFETDPEYQAQLDWADEFVREEVEPLDLVFRGQQFSPPDDRLRQVIDPLKEEVRKRQPVGHPPRPRTGRRGARTAQAVAAERDPRPLRVGPDHLRLPGPGHRERRDHRPLRHAGAEGALPAPAARRRDLLVLLDDRAARRVGPDACSPPRPSGTATSGSSTGGSSSPRTPAARRSSSSWRSPTPTSARTGACRCSWCRPDTPGVNIERNIGVGGEPLGEGHHALIHYEDVRVPADALLGGEGQAFAIAQTRLGGGRIHHAMRTIGQASKALDMMCERALSRTTQGSLLAEKQFVQGYIADSYAQLTQFRLLVLYTAWSIDKHKDYRKVRKDIATVKVRDARRAARHRAAGAAGPRRARREQRDAVPPDDHGGERHGDRRRADRGAQGHRGPPGAARLQRRATTCGPASTSPSAWPRRGPSTPSTWSTRSAISDRRPAPRRVDG